MNNKRDALHDGFVIGILSLIAGLLFSVACHLGEIRKTLDRAYPPPKESPK